MFDLYVLYAILGCWLFALSGVAGVGTLGFWSLTKPGPFANTIKKLILANNIDRAIKLCASSSPSILAQKTKALLCAANRPHRLELAFQEGSAYFASKKLGRLASARALVGGGTSLTLLAGFIFSAPNPLTLYCFSAVFLVVWSLAAVMLGQFGARMIESKECLMDIRNTLYVRGLANGADYLPPSLRPRENYSQEELAAWQLSMNDFEKRMTERRKTDKTFDIGEAYDAEADAAGVLPKI